VSIRIPQKSSKIKVCNPATILRNSLGGKTRRRRQEEHVASGSELGRALRWCRWGGSRSGARHRESAGFGAGASGKVSDCERHVKVGVQSSAFVRLSRFGREQMGVPIATLPLQEDARASLKEVFVVEAVRVWLRRSARSKQGERWTRGDP
jgi:hypothetical protein